MKTISDALYDIIEERRHDGGNPMPLHDRTEYLLNRECVYEGRRFDLYLVGNCDFDKATEEYRGSTGEAYLGKIEYDADVQGHNLAGKSLLDLPGKSPASLSVKEILANAAEITGGG